MAGSSEREMMMSKDIQWPYYEKEYPECYCEKFGFNSGSSGKPLRNLKMEEKWSDLHFEKMLIAAVWRMGYRGPE